MNYRPLIRSDGSISS